MRHLLIALALALPQMAQAMPNDPDVKGLEVAQAILPDAFGKEPACLIPELGEQDWPQADALLPWAAPRQRKLLPTRLAQQVTAAWQVVRPIPAGIIDRAELRSILPQARFDDGSPACHARVTLGLPRVAGDWAFVARGVNFPYITSTFAFPGIIIAYRREQGRWHRVAMALFRHS